MDLLNSAASEKLALPDFNYATQYVPMAAQWELGGSFILPPNQACIVSGFAPAFLSSQNAVTVNATTDGSTPSGTALLGYMDPNGTVRYGMLMPRNNAQSQSQSLAALTAGSTYNAYIRFNYVPAVPQNRAFEAKPNSPAEYAQLVNTRLQAIWELRVELASVAMSLEWLPIATIVIGQGSTPTALTDTRVLYFEGSPASNYAPTWGTTADRAAVRTTAATGAAKITDLRTELDAIRQCLVDIKGPGLQPWQSSCIGGMNIGAAFAASPATGLAQTAPTDATVAFGDRSFLLQGVSAATGIAGPRIAFNAAATGAGYFNYVRAGGAADVMTYVSAGQAALGVTNGMVGMGAVAGAPLACLHVQPYTGIVARFDGPSASAGMTAVQVVGYNTNDATYISFGDGANPASTRRAVWHIGQIAANTFGITGAGTSPPTYYQYNPTTQVSYGAPTYNTSTMLNTYQTITVTGRHDFYGYVVANNGMTVTGVLAGNTWACNTISTNSSQDGISRPSIYLSPLNTITGFTTGNQPANMQANGFIWAAAYIQNNSASDTSATTVRNSFGGAFATITASNFSVTSDSHAVCTVTFSKSIPNNAIVSVMANDARQNTSNYQVVSSTQIQFWFTVNPRLGFCFTILSADGG